MATTTLHLPRTLAARGTPALARELTAELECQPPSSLPLEQALTRGSHVSETPFKVMVLQLRAEGPTIDATLGIHFQSLIAGCSCADDPTTNDELSEYCRIELTLESDGRARLRLLGD